MLKKIFAGSVLALTLLSSTASANSYSINGQRYYPISKSQASGFAESGKATWYGGYFNGRRAADGSIYNISKLTAAHKTLPFGSKVRVTNKANGKFVDVVITDRGPFTAGKIIDLTPRAFNAIGNTRQGVLNVKIEVIGFTK